MYPLAALGGEDWRNAIHAGVFSDAAGRVATRVSRGGRPMAKGGGNNSIKVRLGRKAKNSLARTGHQRGMGGRETEETLRTTPHRHAHPKPCQQSSSGNVRKSHVQRKRKDTLNKNNPCTDGRPSENTPPWLGLHQSSLPNATKGYPPREPRETTQGRDGRTARRHHTGILRRGVWC